MATAVSSSKNNWGIIVGGGSGNRFGSETPKQFLTLGKKWVIEWSIEQFVQSSIIEHFLVVVPSEWVEECNEKFALYKTKLVKVLAGGETRFQSVVNGLAALPDTAKIVLIHDAARPGVTTDLLQNVLEAAIEQGAALPVTPIAATVKQVEGKLVMNTLDRSTLRLAQTPQGFQVELLRQAIRESKQDNNAVTDEIQLIEAITPKRVKWVDGSSQNEKITTAEDFERIERLLMGNAVPEIRTGIGYDVHRLIAGRPFILGGVEIPSPVGLLGHSDADVLCHAIADAILGAASLGDIGVHFPDTDVKWKGISSLLLLKHVNELISAEGYAIGNVDATVLLEAPKVMPYRQEMKKNIADALSIDSERVSIKATTNERLGFIGREEGAAAMAVATLRRLPRV